MCVCCCVCVLVSHSMQHIVTRASLQVWNKKSLECTRSLKGHTGSVLCLQFSDDMIISGSSDATVRYSSFSFSTPPLPFFLFFFRFSFPISSFFLPSFHFFHLLPPFHFFIFLRLLPLSTNSRHVFSAGCGPSALGRSQTSSSTTARLSSTSDTAKTPSWSLAQRCSFTSESIYTSTYTYLFKYACKPLCKCMS